MKILYSSASPYASKVRMAAAHLGLDAEAVSVDAAAQGPELTDINPLGKIPALIRDDGPPVFDSRSIMRYLDRMGKTRLYPRNAAKATDVETLEALCDGICDCLLAIRFEHLQRPAEKLHQPWIDRQWSKVERSLDHLENNLPRLTKSLHAGHIATAAVIAYLGLRFAGQWERGRPKIKAWNRKFAMQFPELDALRPKL